MKLVFLTQVIDAGDAVLGFVPRWIEGLARHCEHVRVVALEVGDIAGLPANVDVREIGRRGVVRRWLRYRGVLAEALEQDGFDTVLAHMVPRYALLAQVPARRAGAGLYLWYTHAAVDTRLLRALAVVEKAFTASPESLRVDTPKRVVTGHGIDLAHFAHRAEEPARPPRIVSVGRLTPAKDPLTILEALAALAARGVDLSLDLVGEGLTVQDRKYETQVLERVERLGLKQRVTLAGAVPYRDIPRWYRRASVVVNASRTGSVDKVVLEAWASARMLVSCNEAIAPLLGGLGPRAALMHFPPGDPAALADRLEALLALKAEESAAIGESLRGIVARDHEVDALMARLVREMGGAA